MLPAGKKPCAVFDTNTDTEALKQSVRVKRGVPAL
jgi:hypothetical protein